MSTHRYWKANKATSAKILAVLEAWEDIKRRAQNFARRHGAKKSSVYTNRSFFSLVVSGVIFPDASKVDTKNWKRLKHTADGWAPKRTKANREISKEFDGFSTCLFGSVMDLIGMEGFSTPGIHPVGKTVYLVTPDDVEAKGCTRISDIAFEKATKGKS